MAEQLTADWDSTANDPPTERALITAGWQLVQAARLRAIGAESVANMTDHLAEACITGWLDELTVRTTRVEDNAG